MYPIVPLIAAIAIGISLTPGWARAQDCLTPLLAQPYRCESTADAIVRLDHSRFERTAEGFTLVTHQHEILTCTCETTTQFHCLHDEDDEGPPGGVWGSRLATGHLVFEERPAAESTARWTCTPEAKATKE